MSIENKLEQLGIEYPDIDDFLDHAQKRADELGILLEYYLEEFI